MTPDLPRDINSYGVDLLSKVAERPDLAPAALWVNSLVRYGPSPTLGRKSYSLKFSKSIRSLATLLVDGLYLNTACILLRLLSFR